MPELSPDRISSLKHHVAQIIAGKKTCVPFPWDMLSRLTNALLPGTITLLCGAGGSAKSLSILQSFMFWHEHGIKCAYYELEEDKDYLLMRLLAQRCQISGLTVYDWIKDHPFETQEAIEVYDKDLKLWKDNLWASPVNPSSYAELAEWIEQRASEGYRIVCIDPITMATAPSGKPWLEQSDLIHHAKRIARAYGLSVIFVTHPTKTSSVNPEQGGLAGGAAFSRFIQTIIWLQMHEDKLSSIKTPIGTDSMTHNRTMHILKARNGRGGKCKLGFYFNDESLLEDELGLIIKKKKKE